MDLTSYDNALKTKLLDVFPNVVNSSEDKALEYSEDDRAMVKLPLISYWRLSNPLSQSYNNSFGVQRGRTVRQLNSNHNLIYKEIYLTLTYQIDVWSDRRYEVDEILKELLLYFEEEPYLSVKEDNNDIPFDISFDITDIVTDIDLSSFSDRGNLYRQSITIEIDRAVLTYPKAKKVANSIPLRTVLVGSEAGD